MQSVCVFGRLLREFFFQFPIEAGVRMRWTDCDMSHVFYGIRDRDGMGYSATQGHGVRDYDTDSAGVQGAFCTTVLTSLKQRRG